VGRIHHALLPAIIMHSVGNKIIPEICKANAIAYCPTMDLVAVATQNRNLHVFRLNGQRVFGALYEDSDFDVVRVRWKPNGAAPRT
jgi:anaphase-promoting complex subunit 4